MRLQSACLTGFLWLVLASHAEGTTRIGLLPLDRVGEADPAYDSLELSLHRQSAVLGGVPATDVVLPSGCPASEARCLAQAGQASGADVVLAGSIERFADAYALRLRAVSTSGGEARELKRLVQGGAPDLMGVAELTSCQLLRLEPCEGSLRVTGVPNARLVLDGKEAGPLPFTGSIAIGRHSLKVTQGARASVETWVSLSWKQELAFNAADRANALVLEKSEFAALPEIAAPAPTPSPVTTADAAPPVPLSVVGIPPAEVKVETAPPPTAPPVVQVAMAPPSNASEDLPLPVLTPTTVTEAPPVETPVAPPVPLRPAVPSWHRIGFFTAAGATGAFLLGGIIAGSVSLGTANALNEKFTAGTLKPSDRAGYDTARNTAMAANVLFGLAGLGAVTTGVFFLTDPRVLGSGGDTDDRPRVGVGPGSVTVQGRF